MTLRQQFSILTSLLVIVLWLGNLLVTVMNGRDYFQQQLNGRAYDAATSLALSMSQVDTRDDVQLSRLIDVLFDRGFFEAIEFIRGCQPWLAAIRHHSGGVSQRFCLPRFVGHGAGRAGVVCLGAGDQFGGAALIARLVVPSTEAGRATGTGHLRKRVAGAGRHSESA